MVHFDGPGLGISFRIIDRNFDFHVAVIHAPEPLGHLARCRERAALDLQPYVITEAGGFHDQCVSVPFSSGVAVPPGIYIVAWQWPPVCEDLPDTCVRF